MSKAKKKIIEAAKLPTKIEAIIIASELVKDLLEKDCHFNFYCKRELNCFQFIAIKDYQLIKHYFPEFEIKLDIHKTAYVELIINYEN